MWKRARRSLKAKRDEAAFRQAQQRLERLEAAAQEGRLEVFYFDQAGVQSCPCVPYAWQPQGQTLELPAHERKRLNLVGFFNRDNVSYLQTVGGTVDSQTVIEAIDAFHRSGRRSAAVHPHRYG